MRIAFHPVRHGLAVLAAIYGIRASQPAISQPAANFDVVEATIDGIHAAMRSGGLTCTQLVQSYLDRIAAYDQAGPKLNAVQNVNPGALRQAADLDAKFNASGEMAPLHCVPVLVKDQIETDFMPTTYGSAMFKTFTPKRNATVDERLQRAGAVILAKTNMGEFAAPAPPSATATMRMIPLITPAGRLAAPASASPRASARSESAKIQQVRYVDPRRTVASLDCTQRFPW